MFCCFCKLQEHILEGPIRKKKIINCWGLLKIWLSMEVEEKFVRMKECDEDASLNSTDVRLISNKQGFEKIEKLSERGLEKNARLLHQT